jgi:hypothetical protein
VAFSIVTTTILSRTFSSSLNWNSVPIKHNCPPPFHSPRHPPTILFLWNSEALLAVFAPEPGAGVLSFLSTCTSTAPLYPCDRWDYEALWHYVTKFGVGSCRVEIRALDLKQQNRLLPWGARCGLSVDMSLLVPFSFFFLESQSLVSCVICSIFILSSSGHRPAAGEGGEMAWSCSLHSLMCLNKTRVNLRKCMVLSPHLLSAMWN